MTIYKWFCSHLQVLVHSLWLIFVSCVPSTIGNYIILSSTGVRLPHQVVLNRLCWQWRAFPYGPQEHVCVFKTALTFVDSVAELWGPLLQGRNVLVVPRDVTKDPERLLHVLEEQKVGTNLHEETSCCYEISSCILILVSCCRCNDWCLCHHCCAHCC